MSTHDAINNAQSPGPSRHQWGVLAKKLQPGVLPLLWFWQEGTACPCLRGQAYPWAVSPCARVQTTPNSSSKCWSCEKPKSKYLIIYRMHFFAIGRFCSHILSSKLCSPLLCLGEQASAALSCKASCKSCSFPLLTVLADNCPTQKQKRKWLAWQRPACWDRG